MLLMGLEDGDSGVGKGHRSDAVPVRRPTGSDGAAGGGKGVQNCSSTDLAYWGK